MIDSTIEHIDRSLPKKTLRTDWIKVFDHQPDAPVRLYCFPYIGGSANTFKRWPALLSDQVETCAVQLPGREERRHEPPCENIDIALRHLAACVCADPRPFIFFGHSFGSVLAFALATQLQAHGREPSALIVSARPAPHITNPKKRSRLPRVQLIQELMSLGGTPEAVLQDAALMDAALRIVRADYSILESFDPVRYTQPVACPIIAFEARNDHFASSTGIDAWCEYTQAHFTKYIVDGGHFYLNSHPEILFATIRAIASEIPRHAPSLN